MEQLDFIIIVKEEMDYLSTRRTKGTAGLGREEKNFSKQRYVYPNKTRGILDREKVDSPAENIRTGFAFYQPGWEGSLGRMDTCISMADSLRCSPEVTTTLLISYTPTPNKKVYIKKKKRRSRGSHRHKPAKKEGVSSHSIPVIHEKI